MAIDEIDEYQKALERCASYIIDSLPQIMSLSGKTVLITGATGQIGGALVDLLSVLARNVSELRILATFRNKDKLMHRFSYKVLSSIEFLPYDALDAFKPQKKIDYIVHCASYGDPKSFADNPTGILKSNIIGLINILDYCVTKNDTSVLFVSSGEVYGQPRSDTLSFSEDYCGFIDTMIPRSCYPIAKKAGESLCSSYCAQYGVDVKVVRQCHVFGPGYSSGDSRVTAQFFDNAKSGANVVMKSTGSQVRSYMFELDVATAYLFIMLKGKKGEVYNVAPSYTISIKQFGEAVAKAADVDFIRETNARDSLASNYSNIKRSVLNADRLKMLGWCCQYDFNDAIQTTISVLVKGAKDEN